MTYISPVFLSEIFDFFRNFHDQIRDHGCFKNTCCCTAENHNWTLFVSYLCMVLQHEPVSIKFKMICTKIHKV